jgi:hypothetical protein
MTSFFDYLGEFASNFIQTSRTRDLSLVSKWRPEIRDQILNTSVSLPLMSKNLGSFGGFFEKDFRIFDFYLGMVDAHLFVEEIKRRKDILFPENPESPDWAPFFCIEGAIKKSPDQGKYCDGSKMDRNLLILLQTSFTQLYNECSFRKSKPLTDSPHCLAGFSKAPPPLIISEGLSFIDWRRYQDEEPLDYLFRLLSNYHFQFKDLKLYSPDPTKGQFELRKKIGHIFSIYMDKLPANEQTVLRRGGDTILNQKIFYMPRETSVFLTLGRALELGWNFKRADFLYPSFLKLNTSILFQGAYDLVTGNKDVFAVSPLIGMTYEFSFNDYKWQYFLGLEGGHQFSNGPGCNIDGIPNIMINCHGFTLLPYIGVSFLELVRFQILYNWLPSYRFPRFRDNFLLQLGAEF